MNKLTCGYPYNGLFVMRDNLGYIVKSCCEQKDIGYRVNSITDILSHDYIQDTRNSFEQGQWPLGCESCRQLESQSLESQRNRSFSVFQMEADKVRPQHFNIRLDNQCNLKCIICNPVNSSKWEEDRDIYTIHTNDNNVERTRVNEKELELLIKDARSITVLGGEPLASKNTLQLLDQVSNPEQCALFVNTNAVSWSQRADKTISKPWKAVVMNLSVDAIGEEFELQRFPAKWQDVENFSSLCMKKGWYIAINTTVSALSWQSIPALTSWVKSITPHYQLNLLTNPSQFHINALKSEAINQIDVATLPKNMKAWQASHVYDADLNQKLKKYLTALDQKRGTNSKSTLPWCWL